MLAEAGWLGAGALAAFGFGVWQFGPDWWRQWGWTFYAPYSAYSSPLFVSPYLALLLFANLRLAFLLGRMAWRRGGTGVLWLAVVALGIGFVEAVYALFSWYQVTQYEPLEPMACDAIWSAWFALLASGAWVTVMFLAAFVSLRDPRDRPA